MSFSLNYLSHLIFVSVCTYLLTRNAWISVGRRSKHEVVEHRGVGSHPDASSDHHRDFELVPILISSTERTLDTNFRTIVLRIVIAGIEVVAELPRPRSLSFYVAWQKILVRCRGQREGMKLVGLESGAGETHPLTRQVLQVRRSVEFDLYHVGGQQFRLDDVQGHVFGSQTDDLKSATYLSRYQRTSDYFTLFSDRMRFALNKHLIWNNAKHTRFVTSCTIHV